MITEKIQMGDGSVFIMHENLRSLFEAMYIKYMDNIGQFPLPDPEMDEKGRQVIDSFRGVGHLKTLIIYPIRDQKYYVEALTSIQREL